MAETNEVIKERRSGTPGEQPSLEVRVPSDLTDLEGLVEWLLFSVTMVLLALYVFDSLLYSNWSVFRWFQIDCTGLFASVLFATIFYIPLFFWLQVLKLVQWIYKRINRNLMIGTKDSLIAALFHNLLSFWRHILKLAQWIYKRINQYLTIVTKAPFVAALYNKLNEILGPIRLIEWISRLALIAPLDAFNTPIGRTLIVIAALGVINALGLDAEKSNDPKNEVHFIATEFKRDLRDISLFRAQPPTLLLYPSAEVQKILAIIKKYDREAKYSRKIIKTGDIAFRSEQDDQKAKGFLEEYIGLTDSAETKELNAYCLVWGQVASGQTYLWLTHNADYLLPENPDGSVATLEFVSSDRVESAHLDQVIDDYIRMENKVESLKKEICDEIRREGKITDLDKVRSRVDQLTKDIRFTIVAPDFEQFYTLLKAKLCYDIADSLSRHPAQRDSMFMTSGEYYTEAEGKYSEQLKQEVDPNHLRKLKMARGKAMARAGRYDEAINIFTSLIEDAREKSDKGNIHRWLAHTYKEYVQQDPQNDRVNIRRKRAATHACEALSLLQPNNHVGDILGVLRGLELNRDNCSDYPYSMPVDTLYTAKGSTN